jgi:topoisomerase-4 subunit B
MARERVEQAQSETAKAKANEGQARDDADSARLQTEDISARLHYVLSARILEPQFKGQVKNELISRDAVKLVSLMVRDAIELWLNQNVDEGKRIADLVLRQAAARTRAAQKIERRKSSGVAVLPGKLTDCASEDPERNELFIVEGDSAGGSAKQARDRRGRLAGR